MSTSNEEERKGDDLRITEPDQADAATEQQIKKELERRLVPQPPPDLKQMRFTVICGSKKLLADHDQRDIAAVHILAIDQESAKFSARQLLGANVKGTTPDDWDAVIAYLGFQEIL